MCSFKSSLEQNKQTTWSLACFILHLFHTFNCWNINTCVSWLLSKLFQLCALCFFSFFTNLFCLHYCSFCTNNEKQFYKIFAKTQVHKHNAWKLWLSNNCFFSNFFHFKPCLCRIHVHNDIHEPFSLVFFINTLLCCTNINEGQCFLFKKEIWHRT